MTSEKFEEDLAHAQTELTAATEDVMSFVRAGKAFGDEWRAAVKPNARHIGEFCGYLIAL
jgi:hypothetical protein